MRLLRRSINQKLPEINHQVAFNILKSNFDISFTVIKYDMRFHYLIEWGDTIKI